MQLFDYEKQHIDLLRGSLAECTLFLKRNDRFPLSVPGKIAAYGNGVRHTIKGGTGSGEVNSRYFVSVEEGLRAAGFTITTNNWLDAYDLKLAQALVLDFIKKLCVCHFSLHFSTNSRLFILKCYRKFRPVVIIQNAKKLTIFSTIKGCFCIIVLYCLQFANMVQ